LFKAYLENEAIEELLGLRKKEKVENIDGLMIIEAEETQPLPFAEDLAAEESCALREHILLPGTVQRLKIRTYHSCSRSLEPLPLISLHLDEGFVVSRHIESTIRRVQRSAGHSAAPIQLALAFYAIKRLCFQNDLPNLRDYEAYLSQFSLVRTV